MVVEVIVEEMVVGVVVVTEMIVVVVIMIMIFIFKTSRWPFASSSLWGSETKTEPKTLQHCKEAG